MCRPQIAVMYAYIDGEDFAGSGFDDALRSLLATFRLPGLLYWKIGIMCTLCMNAA